jgi:hypothetical protein
LPFLDAALEKRFIILPSPAGLFDRRDKSFDLARQSIDAEKLRYGVSINENDTIDEVSCPAPASEINRTRARNQLQRPMEVVYGRRISQSLVSHLGADASVRLRAIRSAKKACEKDAGRIC